MKTFLVTDRFSEYLQGVKDLQARNHKDVVGTSERGFLTCQFSVEEIGRFASEAGIIVVTDDNGSRVLGYNILLTIERTLTYPAYRGLVHAYQELRPECDLSKVLLARQYCVDESARGGPAVKSLYDVMRSKVCIPHGYTYSIGEIDERNRISMVAARRLLGYTFIGSYQSDGITWNIGERLEIPA
ncbi:MAG: hypothetical protein RL150_259 [Candidatus Parcubacteria bacterium]|jgi:hypothetical protein